MKISIIITNFNYGKYIERCIRSCMNQNYSSGLKNLNKDFEIIVVDDCSTDDSKKKITRYEKFINFNSIFNKKILELLLARKSYFEIKRKIFY